MRAARTSLWGAADDEGDLMTEAEWLECDAPEQLLDHLAHPWSARKVRLYAAACCRSIWDCSPQTRGGAWTFLNAWPMGSPRTTSGGRHHGLQTRASTVLTGLHRLLRRVRLERFSRDLSALH